MKEIEIAVSMGKDLRPDEVKRCAARTMGLSRKALINVIDPSHPERISIPDADLDCVISHRSVDARGRVLQRYKVQIYTREEHYTPYAPDTYKDVHDSEEVIVVGAGPAGMFAALKLLMLGLKPIVLERGKDVHARKKDMASLSRDGVLNPESNYCYGEGGAGAFSDGKLYTRSSKRGDNREVLYQLVNFGAIPSTLIDAHPHIGTDRLPIIVENIRHCIVEHGGEYHFNTRVSDLMSEESSVTVIAQTPEGQRQWNSKAVIMATGHSAIDVYEMFHSKGWPVEPKGFALGVRVEHPQSLINQARYHGHYEEGFPAAEYSFVEQVEGRGVFSFCMCPGGILVPSSTEEKTVVLNGMSNSNRSSRWANAGVVVSIEPEDVPAKYQDDGPFSVMNYQRDIERSMYNYVHSISGGNGAVHEYAAPAQRMVDFCRCRKSVNLPETSYHPGVVSAPLHEILPPLVADRLRKAFPLVDKKIPGYYTNEALLLGTESRTSSAIRIPRDSQTLQCVKGVFPCGEGAGYSGGIVSSAIDGIRCAVEASTLITKKGKA